MAWRPDMPYAQDDVNPDCCIMQLFSCWTLHNCTMYCNPCRLPFPFMQLQWMRWLLTVKVRLLLGTQLVSRQCSGSTIGRVGTYHPLFIAEVLTHYVR
jgi:hypothetical protein